MKNIFTIFTLFLLITQILCQGCGEPEPCIDQSCCLCRQIPNVDTGVGFYEFDGTCTSGGLHCVDNSGCRLCYKPTFGVNLGDRPVCERFMEINPQCNDENCCLANQIPNLSDGNGYLEFEESCKNGGLHCVADSGCRLCFKPKEQVDSNGGLHMIIGNVGDRPICRRFSNIISAASIVTISPNCADEQCCLDNQNPNNDNGNGFLEFDSGCKINGGGLHCVHASGCRLCYKPSLLGTNVGERPICQRFIDVLPLCSDEGCCSDLQKANEDDGNGFLEFNADCKSNGGGLHCVHNTGCRLCFKPDEESINVGERPVCQRFI